MVMAGNMSDDDRTTPLLDYYIELSFEVTYTSTIPYDARYHDQMSGPTSPRSRGVSLEGSLVVGDACPLEGLVLLCGSPSKEKARTGGHYFHVSAFCSLTFVWRVFVWVTEEMKTVKTKTTVQKNNHDKLRLFITSSNAQRNLEKKGYSNIKQDRKPRRMEAP
ncbi:unnamed protein product [Spirodela intermedia]|uniref:Uncharacterized protein n=1 Tax=Spirodela intermedia TaxID=51605 RepID=A0A7I8LLG2_SPIIN|nr:unnamed protein product [Spirodela intermedia]